MTFLFSNAAKYYKELAHQKTAWEYLDSNCPESVKQEFIKLYRSAPTPSPKKEAPKLVRFMRLLSQRDNKGDFNKDGRADWFQTCNVTSCAMVIEYLTGKKVDPQDLNREMTRRGLSIYSHANLVKILSESGVKSIFSTSTPLESIKRHLNQNNPVIWSNKLTHGGHLVVLAQYSSEKNAFLVFDPYGEPFPTTNGKWVYKDIRKPYWLSIASFKRATANTANLHWAHLCSKA